MEQPPKGAWEGLGGPIQWEERNGSAWLDPTLDSCCQRDMEERAKFGAMQRTLKRFDVVAERERRRKHLVQTPSHIGCRCLYDPQVDGGEYFALTELRAKRPSLFATQKNSSTDDVDVNVKNDASRSQNTKRLDEEKKENAKHEKNQKSEQDSDDDEDDDDDDEFDYLLDEDIPGAESEAVRAWEEARMMEMEAIILRQEVEEYHGYGKHRQFHPRRVASVVGMVRDGKVSTTPPPPVVVLHLYDSESMASAWLDSYLEEFAAQARGTLFIRSHGRGTLFQEDTGPLQSRLHAQTDMPALVLMKEGVVATVCPNLSDILIDSPEEDQPHVDRSALEAWLFKTGALDQRTPPAFETLCRMRPEEEALMDSLRAPTQQSQESYYNCGLPGCQKTFAHEHVGITTEQQDGMVVSANKVLGTEG